MNSTADGRRYKTAPLANLITVQWATKLIYSHIVLRYRHYE